MGLIHNFRLTLAIFKPDVVANPVAVQEIKDILLKRKFLIVTSKLIYPSRDLTRKFYVLHKDKFFYARLVNYMACGPIMPLVLYRDNCISKWRELMGPTKVFKTIYDQPETIRGMYGLTDTRNSTHGSDSEITAMDEMKFFFPTFDPYRWLASEERSSFDSGAVEFDDDQFCHHIRKTT